MPNPTSSQPQHSRTSFRPAGLVEWAKLSLSAPRWWSPRRAKGRRAQGIRYEKKVHEVLSRRLGAKYVPNPWFVFGTSEPGPPRWCQPDGLVINIPRGMVTIIEVKYQHVGDAWHQLRELYCPVVARAFGPGCKVGVVEVTKWYDPATRFPEPITLVRNVEDIDARKFGVHILKP